MKYAVLFLCKHDIVYLRRYFTLFWNPNNKFQQLIYNIIRSSCLASHLVRFCNIFARKDFSSNLCTTYHVHTWFFNYTRDIVCVMVKRIMDVPVAGCWPSNWYEIKNALEKLFSNILNRLPLGSSMSVSFYDRNVDTRYLTQIKELYPILHVYQWNIVLFPHASLVQRFIFTCSKHASILAKHFYPKHVRSI